MKNSFVYSFVYITQTFNIPNNVMLCETKVRRERIILESDALECLLCMTESW